MPLYEYECDACTQRFEVIQKFSDAPVETCAACGRGPVHRLLSSPAIQFKGSGWYITDYAQKAKSDGKAEPSSGAEKPAASAEKPSSEAKADTKTGTAGEAKSTPKADAEKT